MSQLLQVKGPYKFHHLEEQRGGRRGCCPEMSRGCKSLPLVPPPSCPQATTPGTKTVALGDAASDKGPAQGASKKNRDPCSLSSQKGGTPRPLSTDHKGGQEPAPVNAGRVRASGASGGGGQAGSAGRGPLGPWVRGGQQPGHGSRGKGGQLGLSSCPGSPHRSRRPAPRDPAPAASLAPTHLPRSPPGPSPIPIPNPSPVPPATGPRAASARFRQGYEVHREEDERATVEEREDEHHRLHPPARPLLRSNRLECPNPPPP